MDYQARLAEELTRIPGRAQNARRILNAYSPFFYKYHGGLPVGFLAAIAEWESGGNINASGDTSLGEAGILQVISSFPPQVGVDPDLRRTAEGGIFLGSLWYQIAAKRLASTNPRDVRLGTRDNWLLARLAGAVGPNGCQTLINMAPNKYPGHVYEAILRITSWPSLGSQDPAKVQFRAHHVWNTWISGQLTMPDIHGIPERIPAPSGVSYNDGVGLVTGWITTTTALVGLAAFLSLAEVL